MQFKKSITSKNIDKAIYLVIVESPSKCSKIETYLGSQYACIASMGHIREISGLKNIDTKNNFNVKYNIIESKEAHIHSMRNCISKFNTNRIYIATDDDREGEAIGWHICDLFNLNIETTHRIIFHEITKEAIIKSIENPTVLNMNIVNAAISRQVLDLIVGFRISPILWKHLYNDKTNALSAGRCQTPCLGLVYDNYMLDRSKVDTKFKIKGIFTSRNLEFTLNKDFNSIDEIDQFMRSSKDFTYKMTKGKSGNRTQSPPKPFNTSRLIQHCCNSMNIGSQYVMKLCQELYQHGYITYMRTDSTSYSSEFIKKCKDYIINTYSNDYFTKNVSLIENTNKKDPHEAIRVTNINNTQLNIQTKDNKIKTLYKIIWKNTIESCMSEYKYKYTGYNINSPLDKVYYEYIHEVPIFLGWKVLNEKIANDDLTLFLNQQLNKTEIQYSKIYNEIINSKGIPYYSESSLVHKLEEIGIGRPSTFASIVNTIIERKYVEKKDIEGIKYNYKMFTLTPDNISVTNITKTLGSEKNKLLITNIGILCYRFLNNVFNSLFSYNYTADMETELDKISDGSNDKWYSICDICYKEISSIIKDNKNIQKYSHEIADNIFVVFERFGPSLKYVSDTLIEYKNIKKTVDLNIKDLENNKYSVSDLLETKSDNLICVYKNTPVYLRNGLYGFYLEWGNVKESLKNYINDIGMITEKEAINILDGKTKNKNIVLELTPNLSLRKGKYGVYAYHKTEHMHKPVFYNIKKLKDGFANYTNDMLIDWLCETYNIDKNTL